MTTSVSIDGIRKKAKISNHNSFQVYLFVAKRVANAAKVKNKLTLVSSVKVSRNNLKFLFSTSKDFSYLTIRVREKEICWEGEKERERERCRTIKREREEFLQVSPVVNVIKLFLEEI